MHKMSWIWLVGKNFFTNIRYIIINRNLKTILEIKFKLDKYLVRYFILLFISFILIFYG